MIKASAPEEPTGPSVWVVSDGRAGIERQALALAAALHEPDRWRQLAHIRSQAHRPQPIRIAPKPPQVWLAPKLWWDPLGALGPAREDLAPPWPDVWIAAGRRSTPYSLAMRRWSRGRCVVVQTQHPRVDPCGFDLVVPPAHDQLEGPNVMPIVGSPVWFDASSIEAARGQWPDLAHAPGPRVLFAVGGHSKAHTLSHARLLDICDTIRALASIGASVWITVSRRTPPAAAHALRAAAADLAGRARFFENEARDGPNPYLAFLSYADAVLVTEDSTNMLSDAAFFGLPIHLVKLDGGARKFDRLHDTFIARGAARRWTGVLALDARYAPLREAARVAERIVALVLSRHGAATPRQSP